MNLIKFCNLIHKYKLHYVLICIIIYASCFNISVIYFHKSPLVNITRKEMKISNPKMFDNILFSSQGPFKFGYVDIESVNLFPYEPNGKSSDRIINQMRFVPANYNNAAYKTIFVEDDNDPVIDISNCPVNKCNFTKNKLYAYTAPIVLLRSFHIWSKGFQPHQYIGIFMLESPINFRLDYFPDYMNRVNWTATYRYDSTIVAPYFKFIPYDVTASIPVMYPLQEEDFSIDRKKHIAWFVSNCYTLNRRMQLAKSLAANFSFQVDIYGGCGMKSCSKDKGSECFEILRDYWFYLALENSNCRYYITEKFFRNALNFSVVPIVMGAHPDDYKLVAPPHSYIHIEDFPSLDQLAKYLRYLMENKTAYNEYFSWKNYGKLDTNTFFWCRVCTMAHYSDFKEPIDVSNFRKWWNVSESCRITTWTKDFQW